MAGQEEEGAGEPLKPPAAALETEPYPDPAALGGKALRQRLKRSKLLTVCPWILGNELCERLAYYSISTNLVVYLKTFLNFTSVDASNAVNNWSGVCYLMPLLGAFLADSYWGRYWTIIAFSLVYIAGLVGLTLGSGVPALHEGWGVSAGGWFLGMLYVIAVGTGGIKPCVSSFGADQFDQSDPEQAREKSSFFSWFYWMINIGALVATLVVVNVQTSVSWTLGYLIPTVSFGVALLLFLLGTRLYHFVPPGGSGLTRIAKVLWFTLLKCRRRLPPVEQRAALLYAGPPDGPERGEKHRDLRRLDRTDYCSFLERAALRASPQGDPAKERHLATLTAVEETKRMVSFLPICVTTVLFNTIYAQMTTQFVEQGLAMDTRVGSGGFRIASASLSSFDTIAIVVLVPIYDRLLLPLLRRRGFRVTYLQRVGAGLIVSMFSMVAAAAVEAYRLSLVRRLGLVDSDAPAPMSVFWLVPQYFLIGAAEIGVNVGTLDLYYSEAPDALRSTASALQLLTVALGSWAATLLNLAVVAATARGGSLGWLPDNPNRGRLDLFYTTLVILSLLNFCLFLWAAKTFKYKKIAEPRPEEDLEATPAIQAVKER